MNQTTFLYFFSALAQSAAAFAGLVAVFAVFRLQTTRSDIAEAFRVARHKLELTRPVHHYQINQPDKDLKKFFEDIRQGGHYTYQYSGLIKEAHEAIVAQEEIGPRLKFGLAQVLKMWAALFIATLCSLALSRDCAVLLGSIVIAVFVGATGYVLFRTGKFIQECL